MKYKVPDEQSEILPNIPGLKDLESISMMEFTGFLQAEIFLSEKLSSRTRFTVSYILKIHRLALKDVYSFAGKYRDVNMSKGGFPFAAARFLPDTMKVFEQEVLSTFPTRYQSKDDLIRDIAVTHAELLFIHPFREGNGRTARILANLMARKAGYELKFELNGQKAFESYVSAIQKQVKKSMHR